MGTTHFACGCSISCSMFGNHEYMFVIPCLDHAFQMQDLLKSVADKIKELTKKESA